MTQWQSESVAMAQYDYWRTCITYTYRHISTHKYIRIQNTLKCVLSAKHLDNRQYTQAAKKKHTHTMENHTAKIECNTAAAAAEGKWNKRAKQWQTVCIHIEWMNMHTHKCACDIQSHNTNFRHSKLGNVIFIFDFFILIFWIYFCCCYFILKLWVYKHLVIRDGYGNSARKKKKKLWKIEFPHRNWKIIHTV